MNRYDIVFLADGHGYGYSFRGIPFLVLGSPVLFTAVAASCLEKELPW